MIIVELCGGKIIETEEVFFSNVEKCIINDQYIDIIDIERIYEADNDGGEFEVD